MSDLRVSRSLTIPSSELRFTFSPSGGPGGQHANKASTRAELTWNVARSNALGPRQRARLLERLANRIDSSGDIRVVSDRFRSQTRNREDVGRRLAEMVAGALATRRARKPTKPHAGATEARIRAKKQRGELKRTRREIDW
jgi:ribosome-associated protein